MGAIIGGCVGVALVLFQNYKKKKEENNDTLDS